MTEDISLADVYNQFSLDVYNNVGSGLNENLFLSTFSILSALSMCIAGARNNTAKQLKQITGFYHVTDEDIYKANLIVQNYVDSLNENMTLSVANRIYPQQGFPIKQEFLNTLQKYYKVNVESVDFGNPQRAAQSINDWVMDQTKNRIKDLIDASGINSLTKLILVNAIYFKANWLQKFLPENTHKDTFYLSDGTTQEVDMMKIVNKKFNYLSGPGDLEGLADVCEFPYEGEELLMTIILPHEGVDIGKVESKLNSKTLKSIIQETDHKLSVNVIIPKFKLESNVELSNKLAIMGATDAFNDNADFSGITDTGLYISKVVHKSFIEVNEEGSEAAAATGVEFAVKSMMIGFKTPEFKVNRPFMFVIHNKYITFFVGKYVKP